MIQKGQNFRVYTIDPTTGKGKVIAMSTNCVVTLTGNSEDASHKDIVSMAAMPTINSKSWSVQVDSLDVTDTAALLYAIANLQKFYLKWDRSSEYDNQSAVGAPVARRGYAFLTDASFVFNDRANATKSIQFTGTGALESINQDPETDIIPVVNTYTKGQFVRLFLSDNNSDNPTRVIAAAKELTLHVAVQMQDATTKDTEGDFQVQEPTGVSFDITSSALMSSGETITSSVGGQTLSEVESIFENSTPVKFEIANVAGENQRSKLGTIASGSVVITQLVMNGQNRANADYNVQLQGFGPLNQPSYIITGMNFALPISQPDLGRVVDPTISFNKMVDLTNITGHLSIYYDNSGTPTAATLTVNGDAINVAADTDNMFKLRVPLNATNTLQIYDTSSSGPVWLAIFAN